MKTEKWSLAKYFEQLRFDEHHHLGGGDIRLTVGQQEELCYLIDELYIRKPAKSKTKTSHDLGGGYIGEALLSNIKK